MTERILIFTVVGFVSFPWFLVAAGYEGFGVTVGGDKSDVVKVTSLADDGLGSLREAGLRRVVTESRAKLLP